MSACRAVMRLRVSRTAGRVGVVKVAVVGAAIISVLGKEMVSVVDKVQVDRDCALAAVRPKGSASMQVRTMRSIGGLSW